MVIVMLVVIEVKDDCGDYDAGDCDASGEVIEIKDDCGDCRMFKSMDCDNLKETSQKMIVDTFAPRRC